MTQTPLTPRISRPTPQSRLLSYPVRHGRITSITSYPRPSSASPEILIYGHSTGLTVIYRSPPPSSSTAAVTASPDDFLAVHTIHLGTPVISLSCAPEHLLTPPSSAADATPARRLLTSNVVVAVTCADKTVRVITMPLEPPEPSSNDDDTKPEHILTLGGGASSHQLPAGSVSLTLLPVAPSSSTTYNTSSYRYQRGDDEDDDGSQAAEEDDDELVVASASDDNTGILIIWRIPIPSSSSSPLSLPRFAPKPIVHRLHSPARALRFNTSPVSVTRRCQLLVAEASGVVRVFDTASTAGGAWILSLHTPVGAGGGRVEVLDTDWCVGGRAVVVVMANGTWGIWDVEGVLRGKMAGLVEFVLEGSIGAPASSTPGATSSTSPARDQRGLTPARNTGSSVAGSVKSSTTTAGGAAAAQAGTPAISAASIAVLQLPDTNLIPASTSSSLHIEDEAIAVITSSSSLASSSANASSTGILYIPSLKRLYRTKTQSSSSSKALTKKHTGKGGADPAAGDEGKLVVRCEGAVAAAGVGLLEAGKVVAAAVGKVMVLDLVGGGKDGEREEGEGDD